jgi:hypothetical protein
MSKPNFRTRTKTARWKCFGKRFAASCQLWYGTLCLIMGLNLNTQIYVVSSKLTLGFTAVVCQRMCRVCLSCCIERFSFRIILQVRASSLWDMHTKMISTLVNCWQFSMALKILYFLFQKVPIFTPWKLVKDGPRRSFCYHQYVTDHRTKPNETKIA